MAGSRGAGKNYIGYGNIENVWNANGTKILRIDRRKKMDVYELTIAIY